MFMLLLALLPAAALLLSIYSKDTVEKEPAGLLVKLFLLGAASVVFAIIVGIVADPIVSTLLDDNSLIWLIVDNFILTALVEEGGKLGGMWTLGLVSPFFDSVGKGGLNAEIRGKLAARGALGGLCDIAFDPVEMELLLDELRDYRFYADDMIHPAPVAVNYIWQRLT